MIKITVEDVLYDVIEKLDDILEENKDINDEKWFSHCKYARERIKLALQELTEEINGD